MIQKDGRIIQHGKNGKKIIINEIKRKIPVGFSHQKEKQDTSLIPIVEEWNHPICYREYDSALHQLGTLGGGNHFIEIQKGGDDFIWIMVHSGSRNLGKKVADHYNKIAIEKNQKWFSVVLKEWELAFLPIESVDGINYLKEMNYCVAFALANRKLMMDTICNIFEHCENEYFDSRVIYFEPMINIAHNYARMENHYGENVLIHRKGATFAGKDNIGIIPGSQGSKSYIIKGKGNRESFNSCSHGAGRIMGRKQAIRELNLNEEINKLDAQGIIHSIHNEKDLDEATGAYKNIFDVMKQQEDLVEILVELTPLAVIKG